MPVVPPDPDEQTICRPETPPLPHMTFTARGVTTRNFEAFKPKDVKSGARDPVTCVAWNCDGTRLASCGHEKGVRLWTPERTLDHRLSKLLAGGHESPVGHLAWHPTSPHLLCSVSRGDKKMSFWDTRQPKALFGLKTPGEIMTTQYSPTGETVLALTQDDAIYLVESVKGENGNPEAWVYGERHAGWGQVNHATFNHVGDLILIVESSGAVEVLKYPDLITWIKVQAHTTSGYTVALDPRGNYVATGGADAIINLFDTREWICCRTFSSEAPVRDLTFSFDGEYLASASDVNGVDIWAVESGQFMHHIPGLGPSATVAWHPSKHILACGGDGGSSTRQGWISFFGL